MAVAGIYFGVEESRLLAMREGVLAQIEKAQQGKRFESFSGAGKAFSKDNVSLPELRAELIEITAALQRLNPETHGKRVRRLHATFNRCDPA